MQESDAHETLAYYYHGDHLGSATWITDANGLPVQYILYDPWGGQFANRNAYGSSGVTERYTFTGTENLSQKISIL